VNVHDPLVQAAFICSVGEKTRNHFWGNISRKIDTGGRRHPPDRLSAAQIRVLDIVRSAERVTVTELAQRLDVSLPSASAMVDRLVRGECLQRARSDRDRRKVVVSVSPVARHKVAKLQKCVHREIIDLIAAIGPEAARKWCDVLQEIQQTLTRNTEYSSKGD
jgi:DNA-binding MarR family transcriptional regulator